MITSVAFTFVIDCKCIINLPVFIRDLSNLVLDLILYLV